MIAITPPAIVEVNEDRQYVRANQSACELLGYTLEELLRMRIDDVSYPSGAHVSPMFSHYREQGGLKGIFAVQTKYGQVLWIRYDSEVKDGRLIARWTEYEPAQANDLAGIERQRADHTR
jgi:PAS domain S-box-containing protein